MFGPLITSEAGITMRAIVFQSPVDSMHGTLDAPVTNFWMLVANILPHQLLPQSILNAAKHLMINASAIGDLPSMLSWSQTVS